MFPLPLFSAKDKKPLQVSKWLKFPVLLDQEEMRDLLTTLGPISIAVVSEPVSMTTGLISVAEFIETYSDYVLALKSGLLPDEKKSRRYFSSSWTSELNALYGIQVGSDKYLIRPNLPVIQLQGHQFFYSAINREFYPMVLGADSIFWGIQFSYPQLFQNPQTGMIEKVGTDYLNTILFQKMAKWFRTHTIPTPFIVDEKRTNSPIRLGKKCLSWINIHSQLKANHITISSMPRVTNA